MWKQLRRNKLQSALFPPAWRRILDQCVPIYARLPEPDKRELEGCVQVFLAEKNFEGCGGLLITEEIKVCVAAQACILLLHRETDYFPGLRSVLIYPSRYFAQSTRHLGSGIIEERRNARSGEAWQHGAVVLAWDAARAGASDPAAEGNVVLHEFAHLLDFEDGWSNGVPMLRAGKSIFPGKSGKDSWVQIMRTEFDQHCAKVESGEAVFLDVYGAKNPAEFFAVATESFFMWPQEMKARHSALYEQLSGFYRQDPAQWIPASPKPPNARACIRRSVAKREKGDLDGAMADLTKAISINPQAAAPYAHRGWLKGMKGDLEGALADCDKAIELDPQCVIAYRCRGRLKYDSRRFVEALVDYRKECELRPALGHGHCRLWLIWARLGERESATEELQTHRENAQIGENGDWVSTLARFLCGQLSETDLFNSAENSDYELAIQQRREAWFYAGTKRVIDGDKAAAMELFEMLLTAGKMDSGSYQSAVAELRFLKAEVT